MTRSEHRRFSHAMVWGLTLSLIWSAERLSLGAAEQNATPRGWQELQTAALGTEVEVTLTTGAKIRGRLVGAEPDAVRLNANDVRSGHFTFAGQPWDTQTFRRSDVKSAKTMSDRSRPSYRSSHATPDAAAVRLVVTALGVGKTVNVATTTSRRIRTRILSIEGLVLYSATLRQARFSMDPSLEHYSTAGSATKSSIARLREPSRPSWSIHRCSADTALQCRSRSGSKVKAIH